MITVSSDYEYQSLIPWGTPLKKGVPEYTGTVERPKSSDAEHQIGIGHDGMWFYPGNLPRILRWETRRGRELPAHLRNKLLWNRYGMLCVNHEFGTNPHVLGKPTPTSLEDVRLSQAVHGVSVVAIYQTRGGHWKVVPSNKNRRITVNTEMHVSGPAADSPLLQEGAGEKVLGTLNNCGSGNTPWGTYVTCEENFNGYFGSTTGSIGGFDEKQDEAYSRYGFSTGGFGYGWHLFDDRFDLSKEEFRNESNRFGWCVEIDPFDKDARSLSSARQWVVSSTRRQRLCRRSSTTAGLLHGGRSALRLLLQVRVGQALA
jgi:secreted PhoX family phosphatase